MGSFGLLVLEILIACYQTNLCALKVSRSLGTKITRSNTCHSRSSMKSGYLYSRPRSKIGVGGVEIPVVSKLIRSYELTKIKVCACPSTLTKKHNSSLPLKFKCWCKAGGRSLTKLFVFTCTFMPFIYVKFQGRMRIPYWYVSVNKSNKSLCLL